MNVDEVKARATAVAVSIHRMLTANGLIFYNARQTIAIVYGSLCIKDNVPDAVALSMIHKELLSNRNEEHAADCPLCNRMMS